MVKKTNATGHVMNHLKIIHEFLQAHRDPEDIPATGFPFVTITRQAAAGGHLLAHVTTTDFIKYPEEDVLQGWHVFDRELCELIAQDPELETSVESLMAERYRPEVSDFVESLLTGRSKQFLLQKKTFRIVRMLATIGKVIIVGRGAQCVTQSMAQGIHVRLVAPAEQRIRWMMRKLNLSREEARKMTESQDKERRVYTKDVFGKDIDDPLLYDATFNSARMDMHEMSRTITEMVLFRAAKQGRETPGGAR